MLTVLLFGLDHWLLHTFHNQRKRSSTIEILDYMLTNIVFFVHQSLLINNILVHPLLYLSTQLLLYSHRFIIFYYITLVKSPSQIFPAWWKLIETLITSHTHLLSKPSRSYLCIYRIIICIHWKYTNYWICVCIDLIVFDSDNVNHMIV